MRSYLYQVVAKGNTLTELKESLEDCLADLTRNSHASGMIKNLGAVNGDDNTDDGMETVDSPFGSVPQENTQDATDVDLDSAGVPWNAKIHSSSKKKVKNGTWKVARGVEDAEVEAYNLRFRNSQPAVRDVAPITVVSPAPVQTAPTAVVTATPAAAPVALPPMPTMNSGHTLDSFKAGFPVILSGLLTEKKISQDYVNQLKTFFGVTEIWNITDAQKESVFLQWSSPEFNLITRVG